MECCAFAIVMKINVTINLKGRHEKLFFLFLGKNSEWAIPLPPFGEKFSVFYNIIPLDCVRPPRPLLGTITKNSHFL